MMNYLFLGGCAFFIVAFPVALVYALLLKGRQGKAEKRLEELLDRAGFTPVDSIPDPSFMGVAPDGKLIAAKKATRHGEDYYWYKKEVKMGNPGGPNPTQTVIRHEIFFPFERDTEKPVTISLIHPKTPKMMITVLAKTLDMAVGGKMSRLDIPAELESNGVLAVYGKDSNDSVYDLVERKTFDLLASAPGRCAVMFLASGKSALVGYEFKDRNVNPDEFWTWATQLINF